MSTYTPRLKATYKESVVPALQKEFKYKSSMQVPRLVKIAVNQGLGHAVGDKKIVENAITEVTMITGPKAVGTGAQKDITNFKPRQGTPSRGTAQVAATTKIAPYRPPIQAYQGRPLAAVNATATAASSCARRRSVSVWHPSVVFARAIHL